MGENKCKDCQYYRQHYSLDGRKIYRVYCGHCTLPGVRRKRPDAKACENYNQSSSLEDGFASKEYLSKELLQYVLSLEILPEIEEGG